MNRKTMGPPLTPDELATYAWQLDVPGFGETGQRTLLDTTCLVSRVGGLGSPLALQLAAAGFGRILLAHGGNLKPGDLNRQVLMTREALGTPRAAAARETLLRFKPEIEVEAIPENIQESNVEDLVRRSDIVFDCAPLFEERLLMNRECVLQGKPLINAAMYCLEGQVLSMVPGQTPCLACLYPENPPHWKRRFPVIGAVSALVANIAAMEGIKLLTGLGTPSLGQLILVDTATMSLNKIRVHRRPDCPVCGKA